MDSQPPPDDDSAFGGRVSRRTLIRLLVGAAIGIPIAVESRTLIGLIDQQFLGGETHQGTTTAGPAAVAVGDEFLPQTTPLERLDSAVVNAVDDVWTFITQTTVENTGTTPYEFQLGTAETTGRDVAGGGTTGLLEPGATITFGAEWTIPEGNKPTAIHVTGIFDPEGDAERVSERVPLGNVPVKRQS